jgi:phage N-6-adenine-methyltransferase
MPIQKPTKSVQTVETPDDFFSAVVARFGNFSWDLAANASNTKCENFFSEEQNSLNQAWHQLGGNLWLNPPFSNIETWAAKCVEESRLGADIFMLVPASVGSDWFRHCVEGKSYALALSPRMTFVGHKDPYPKDLMLCVYNGWELTGFGTWRWR